MSCYDLADLGQVSLGDVVSLEPKMGDRGRLPSTLFDWSYAKAKSKKTSTFEEGCLSLPGQYAEIERPAECHLQYLDFHGKKKEIKADGLLSTCIQHEVDHLDGVLFIDYLSKLKKDMIVKKLKKHKKELKRVVV